MSTWKSAGWAESGGPGQGVQWVAMCSHAGLMPGQRVRVLAAGHVLTRWINSLPGMSMSLPLPPVTMLF